MQLQESHEHMLASRPVRTSVCQIEEDRRKRLDPEVGACKRCMSSRQASCNQHTSRTKVLFAFN